MNSKAGKNITSASLYSVQDPASGLAVVMQNCRRCMMDANGNPSAETVRAVRDALGEKGLRALHMGHSEHIHLHKLTQEEQPQAKEKMPPPSSPATTSARR